MKLKLQLMCILVWQLGSCSAQTDSCQLFLKEAFSKNYIASRKVSDIDTSLLHILKDKYIICNCLATHDKPYCDWDVFYPDKCNYKLIKYYYTTDKIYGVIMYESFSTGEARNILIYKRNASKYFFSRSAVSYKVNTLDQLKKYSLKDYYCPNY